jgi:2-dehydropantoate 2-reductase
VPGPDVALIGTGALVTLIGARLSRAGRGVTLLGTWREAIAAINHLGLTVEDRSGRWSARARALRVDDELEAAPLVIVLVKGQQTAAIASVAGRSVAAAGLVLSLQNGLGSREVLADVVGAERTAAGVAFLGATLLGPGCVRDGGGSRIVIEDGARSPLACESLRAAGFEVTVVGDIRPAQWSKLAVNCAINPLGALRRVPNGALLEDGQTRVLLEAAAREVGVVAASLGIRLERDPAALAVEVARETGHNRCSMLQDVERSASTEIEVLNGAVVREAERLGIPVPVNRRLLDEVRAL